MKTVKRIFTLFLALAMAAIFFACGNKDDKKETDGVTAANTAENTGADDTFASNGAAQAVIAYFGSIETVDTAEFIALMPAFDKQLYGSVTDAEFEGEIKDSLNAKLARFEADCGSGVKFEIKITAVGGVTEKVLDSMEKLYAEDENLNSTKIGEGAEVEFEISVKGSDGEITGNGMAHVIQENGEWKIHNMNLDI